MLIEYTGRHTEVTEKLKAQAEAGLARMAMLFGRAASAHVILSIDKYRKIAEITITDGSQSLVAECASTEMETSLHDALAKIEKQAVRHNQRDTTIRRHPKTDVKGMEFGADVPAL